MFSVNPDQGLSWIPCDIEDDATGIIGWHSSAMRDDKSPKIRIDEIPIKVWIRYMPDYFDDVLKELFGIPRFREIE